MERLFAEPDLFTDAEQPPPVTAKKRVELDDEVVRRNPHSPILPENRDDDESQLVE